MPEIKNIYTFQDMMVSSLRYALGRRTYMVEETAEFIKSYPDLISKRIKAVMLNDLNEYFNMRSEGYHIDDKCDYDVWKDLKEWLELLGGEEDA